MNPLESPVFIIAEAGVNHNGDPDLAFQLVDVACAAGADAIKFQTFSAEKIVTEYAGKASYQIKTGASDESQLSMLKRLELTYEVHHDLMRYCQKSGIQFLSTAFDLESLRFLSNDLGLRSLKIPSGEITNGPLLLAHARTGCDLIVSTGMATLAEIEEALAVIAFGLISDSAPSREEFVKAYSSDEARRVLQDKVTLLHCTSEYPAPLDELNLHAMHTLKSKFGLAAGYSDHSEGVLAPIMAAAMGAVIIEKHFTLDKSMPGPDHKASLDPRELKDMVDSVRQVSLALGDGKKAPSQSEGKNRAVVRKSLVAAKDIKPGELFSEDNVSIKRPGYGRSPMQYWDLLGTTCKRAYQAEEIID